MTATQEELFVLGILFGAIIGILLALWCARIGFRWGRLTVMPQENRPSLVFKRQKKDGEPLVQTNIWEDMMRGTSDKPIGETGEREK
jgi:hypothetical protein